MFDTIKDEVIIPDNDHLLNADKTVEMVIPDDFYGYTHPKYTKRAYKKPLRDFSREEKIKKALKCALVSAGAVSALLAVVSLAPVAIPAKLSWGFIGTVITGSVASMIS